MHHRVGAVVGERIWNFAALATRPSIIRADGNEGRGGTIPDSRKTTLERIATPP